MGQTAGTLWSLMRATVVSIGRVTSALVEGSSVTYDQSQIVVEPEVGTKSILNTTQLMRMIIDDGEQGVVTKVDEKQDGS